MSWLTERVVQVEEASKKHESHVPVSDCSEFLVSFEAQLKNQLHLHNLRNPDVLFLPIKQGCYKKATDLLRENRIEVLEENKPTHLCDCSMLFLYKNKLQFTMVSSYFCKNK